MVKTPAFGSEGLKVLQDKMFLLHSLKVKSIPQELNLFKNKNELVHQSLKNSILNKNTWMIFLFIQHSEIDKVLGTIHLERWRDNLIQTSTSNSDSNLT